MNKILVIAAHPDDELLGCGGTIAKHALNGDEVYTLIVCEGESLRYQGQNIDQSVYIKKSGDILGVKKNFHLRFPDQRLDTFSLVDIITPIEKIVRELKPNIIYLQYGGDINRDHKIVFEASLVALRPIETYIEEIYAYYTVGSSDWGYPRLFNPDTWIDISSTMEVKLNAFAEYISELKEYPHPRSLQSLKNLASTTGNQVFMEYAESFVTIRKVIRG